MGASPPTPDLSVILPSYRCATHAMRSAAELSVFLGASVPDWEVLIVDDGGGDFPAGWQPPGGVRLLRLPENRGKGAAVRAGMLEARGNVRVFTDADLPFSPHLLLAIMELVQHDGFHVVVGDRTLESSVYHQEVSWQRRLASRVFSILVGRVVTGGFFDTQCGLKGFRGDVAERLFRLARLDRFAFDVEILYLALKHRLDIKRIPVRLRANETSTIRIGRDSLRMALDTLRIKLFQLRGAYADLYLSRLTSEEFEQRFGSEAGVRCTPERVSSGHQRRTSLASSEPE